MPTASTLLAAGAVRGLANPPAAGQRTAVDRHAFRDNVRPALQPGRMSLTLVQTCPSAVRASAPPWRGHTHRSKRLDTVAGTGRVAGT